MYDGEVLALGWAEKVNLEDTMAAISGGILSLFLIDLITVSTGLPTMA
ncbi:hypothetical protein PVAP13_4KG200081 [Panicum virgatum]|uniref:Uncharacterized protein n=1 Tax=Panicum virgatum TaxID=38727 RepID=A0A8T0TLK7_PANVG|nr:hypothetical protein PVAP13_4KG200081 [Panicum virgatum]